MVLGRALLAGAVRCAPDEVELTRLDDRLSLRVAVDGPVVVTLRPGSRGRPEPATLAKITALPLYAPNAGPDAESVEVLQPEPSTVDLAEAHRILGGGAGLVPAGADGVAADAAAGGRCGRAGGECGRHPGGYRRGLDESYERQIGTTGVAVDPELYVAFGISGAAQHVGGLGEPEHVVSVNTDPSCPMTLMADLGIVADAPAVLAELAGRLGVTAATAAMPTGADRAS